MTNTSDSNDNANTGDRIAKLMARAGLCSRREAERWITAGRVAIDGVTITQPGITVTGSQRVTVDGIALPARQEARLYRYYKPTGLITSERDPQGRPTVFDELREKYGDRLPRLVSVGRLDVNSEGLLLMTNDGMLARHLEHPDTGLMRRYRVRVQGRVSQEVLDGLAGGVTVDKMRYGPIEARLERQQSSNAWLAVALKEGRNREIRRVMEHFGWRVNRLIRIAYGPFDLGALTPGGIEEVPHRQLQKDLGTYFGTRKKPAAPPRRRGTPQKKT